MVHEPVIILDKAVIIQGWVSKENDIPMLNDHPYFDTLKEFLIEGNPYRLNTIAFDHENEVSQKEEFILHCDTYEKFYQVVVKYTLDKSITLVYDGEEYSILEEELLQNYEKFIVHLIEDYP